jgi:hypothetical protein
MQRAAVRVLTSLVVAYRAYEKGAGRWRKVKRELILFY